MAVYSLYSNSVPVTGQLLCQALANRDLSTIHCRNKDLQSSLLLWLISIL